MPGIMKAMEKDRMTGSDPHELGPAGATDDTAEAVAGWQQQAADPWAGANPPGPE